MTEEEEENKELTKVEKETREGMQIGQKESRDGEMSKGVR